jgi:quercetin dioxygenase-like cupin family protein
VRVDYAPGGYTPGSHRHPAGAYVYVLDGAVRMGLNHQEPAILRAGDALYEGPDDIHSLSANARDTEPASLIAYFVIAEDQPSTVVEEAA